MKNLTLEDVMTPIPRSVRDNMTVEEALRTMREENCRHLPVLHGGKLVGVVSERDLRLVLQNRDKKDIPVSEAMSEKPYKVEAKSELLPAVKAMVANKFGSVVVVNEDDQVVGIFTQLDALRVLSEELEIAHESKIEDDEFHASIRSPIYRE